MRIIQKLQPLFLALAFVFLVLLLRSQWDELSGHTWRLSPAWLFGSTMFLLAAWALEIQIWRTLLRVVGGQLPYWPAARIWFLSAIARYVPGNIWQPLSMTLMGQRRGIAPTVTLTSIVFYQILAVLATLPISAVYVGVTGNWGLLTEALQRWTPLLVAGSLLPVAVYLIRPALLVDVLNWALVKLRRLPLAVSITRPMALWVLLLAMLDWLLWGVSFAMLTFSLQNYSTAEMLRLAPHLVAAYAIAYTIGFVSLLTPSGIGVREGAFYVLLAPLMGGGAVTVSALAMRVWTTLAELVAAGVSILFRDAPAATAETQTSTEAIAAARAEPGAEPGAETTAATKAETGAEAKAESGNTVAVPAEEVK